MGPTLNVQRRKLREQAFNAECSTNILKINREELDALPFSRVRVEDNALSSGAVFGRRLRVQHLQRIPATDGARNHSIDILPVDWRRRWGFCRFFAFDRRFQSLRVGGGNERNHQD